MGLSLMDMVIGAWAVFQVIFPFLVLGLLISIHLRLKDVEKLQSGRSAS